MLRAAVKLPREQSGTWGFRQQPMPVLVGEWHPATCMSETPSTHRVEHWLLDGERPLHIHT
jgi:hypothetical protein